MMSPLPCLECGEPFDPYELDHGICDACWRVLHRSWSKMDRDYDERGQ